MLISLSLLTHYNELVEECIIMNNGSTENYEPVVSFIKQHPELKIQYLESNENLGVSIGKSKIMRMAKAPYLLVIDDDVEFNAAEDLVPLAKLFSEERYIKNKTAIINVAIFYHSTRQRQITAFPHKKLKKYQNKDWFLTGHFIGAAALFRKDVVDAMNYYRHDIIYGSEEYDLGYRVLNAGYTIAYDNCITIWHKESPKGRVLHKEKQALLWHNKARIVWTFLPKKYYYTTNLLWGFRYLLKTNFDFSGFFKTLKQLSKMKKEIEREPINDAALKYLKSVEARLWY